jgi:hypothetical protein
MKVRGALWSAAACRRFSKASLLAGPVASQAPCASSGVRMPASKLADESGSKLLHSKALRAPLCECPKSAVTALSERQTRRIRAWGSSSAATVTKVHHGSNEHLPPGATSVLPFLVEQGRPAARPCMSGFGRCATDAREPRQVRKEATVASLSVCRSHPKSGAQWIFDCRLAIFDCEPGSSV